ncbi:hypothetical protein NDI85_19590 [Halomicroarcula sp. S1AR25-4]|uniref:hypothetical protein n=1 Tax=Haloarcula sp. S1AR25-4 TaxID=2950538 RepID=UPI002876F818|nr:hypothetical protein [Halomicroarcula sp. S1AR25-4]MDS0279991.1 hypothetical protein [Halomicroarcula sp. S1AR25-4]
MKRNTLIAVGLALAVLVATPTVVMATAPSLDTETTDTAGTTEIDGTYTQTYNESTHSFLNTSQDSNQTATELRQGDRLLANYSLNDSANVQHVSTASGTYYHSTELADDGSDYPGLEADAGESVTLEARSINLADSPHTTTNASYTFDVGPNTSFVYYNDSETETAEISTWSVSGLAASLSSVNVFSDDSNDSEAGPARVEQEIGVNGDSQDEIIVTVANSDAQDSMAAVYDASDTSGGVAYLGTAMVNGEVVPMMAEGADAPDWVDTSEDAYMTIEEDGQTATVHNAGAVMDSDDTTATVEITANEKMDFGDAQSMYKAYDYDGSVWYAAFSNGEYFGGNPDYEAVA